MVCLIYYMAVYLSLISPPLKEKILNEKFRSRGGSQVQLFCIHGTRIECKQATGSDDCTKLHFKKIIQPHTDGEFNINID